MTDRQCKRRKMSGSDKARGATNRLEWLRSMDPDVYKILLEDHLSWHAVFRVAMRDIAHTKAFQQMVKKETTGIHEGRCVNSELSRWYARYVSRFHQLIRPIGSSSMLFYYLNNRSVWRDSIDGLSSYLNGEIYGLQIVSTPYGCGLTDYPKLRVAEAAIQNNITVRRSWTKRRMIRELMRVGPNADEPRFKTYLTHRVVKGPCGSWCVVATRHEV